MNSNCVFVGGISKEISVQEIKSFFYRYSYDMRNVRLFEGFAFVNLYSKKDVDRAVCQLNGKFLCGNNVTIAYPKSGVKKGYTWRTNQHSDDFVYRLKVDNLSLSVTCKGLKQFMEQAGKVVYSDVHKIYPGRGVVHFETRQAMNKALDTLNGQVLHRRCVSLYSPKVVQKCCYTKATSYIYENACQGEHFCSYDKQWSRRDSSYSETRPRSISFEAQTENWRSTFHSEQRASFSSYKVYEDAYERRSEIERTCIKPIKTKVVLISERSPDKPLRYIREVHYPPKSRNSKRLNSDAEPASESRLKILKETPVTLHEMIINHRRMSTPSTKINSRRKELFHLSKEDSDLFLISPFGKRSLSPNTSGNDFNLVAEQKTPIAKPHFEARTNPFQSGKPSSVAKSLFSVRKRYKSYSTLRLPSSLNKKHKGPKTPSCSPPPSKDERSRKRKSRSWSHDLKAENIQYNDPKIKKTEKDIKNIRTSPGPRITKSKSRPKRESTSPRNCSDESTFAGINFSGSECFSPFSEDTSSCSKNARPNTSIGYNSLMQVSDIDECNSVDLNVIENKISE